MGARVGERMREGVGKWVGGCVSGWVGGWMGERMREGVNKNRRVVRVVSVFAQKTPNSHQTSFPCTMKAANALKMAPNSQ